MTLTKLPTEDTLPLAGYICPDNVKIKLDECLTRCRMAERCVSKSTLLALSETTHKWDGVPHVTSLLTGHLENWLKAKKDYYISPESRADALLGSTHHKLLEGFTDSAIIPEQHFNNGKWQGTADVIELGFIPDGGYTLIDYKTWGSYKVASVMGIKGSKKLGFTQNASNQDNINEQLQLGLYRLGMQAKYGIEIDQMRVQCTVRDGGTFIAFSRGIFKKSYVIPIPIPDTKYLRQWAELKSSDRVGILSSDNEPAVCSAKERWEDRKCAKYCDVREICHHGRFINIKT